MTTLNRLAADALNIGLNVVVFVAACVGLVVILWGALAIVTSTKIDLNITVIHGR